MRKALKELGKEERHRFKGTVETFGSKNGYKHAEKTLCLKDIVLISTGEVVTDHLWFTVGKQMEELDIQIGDIVSFDARVDSYWKGYRGYRDDVWDKPVQKDYKLSRPTKLKIENREVVRKKITDINKLDKVTKETVITFGMHKGCTLGEILKADFSYIVWLYKKIDENSKGLYRWLHRKPLETKILAYKPPYLKDTQP